MRAAITQPSPASTATTGTIGSRYWNPFTGQSSRNATGTPTQHATSVSRQVQRRRARVIRLRAASAQTARPIELGTAVA